MGDGQRAALGSRLGALGSKAKAQECAGKGLWFDSLRDTLTQAGAQLLDST